MIVCFFWEKSSIFNKNNNECVDWKVYSNEIGFKQPEFVTYLSIIYVYYFISNIIHVWGIEILYKTNFLLIYIVFYLQLSKPWKPKLYKCLLDLIV